MLASRDDDVIAGNRDSRQRGHDPDHSVRASPTTAFGSMQPADQEDQPQDGERDTLENAQGARLEAHVQLQIDRVRQQTRTCGKAEQEQVPERDGS